MLKDAKILVIVAHPDDAESFCGGTIAKLHFGGNQVSLVVCTSGDRGSHNRLLGPTNLTKLRREEQYDAKRILGIHDVIWLDYRDGELAENSDFREKLIRIYRQLKPDLILTFDPWKHYEFHPDHRAVGFIATEARMLADLPWICPELTMEGLNPWHPAEMYLFAPQEPNYWVDISETIEIKIEARLAHKSQNDFILNEDDKNRFIEMIRNMAREAGQGHHLELAEAFHKVDDTELCL